MMISFYLNVPLMISTQNISNFGPTENRSRLMETESSLDFDVSLAEVGAVQIAYFSDQMESEEIYQLFLTTSLFPTILHCSLNTI